MRETVAGQATAAARRKGARRNAGQERSITYRSKEDRRLEQSFPLKSGSLVYMRPGVQQGWKHAILARESIGGRISLTFRLLRPL